MMIASSTADVIITDKNNSSLSVPCSICLDLVNDDGDRSIAKLNCGHKFHLDCIGSAFNTKGTMQCPNCRKIESGRWLFATGSAHADFEDDPLDWMQNDFPHDLSFSRRPFGFHWCPFSGFGVQSLNEEAESSLNSFTNFHGNRAMITEHAAAPSSARSHISHFRPNEHVGNSNFHHHPLNAHSAPRDNLRSANIQHPSWGWNCHLLPHNSDGDYIGHGNLTPVTPATLRPTHARAQADAVARSPSFHHPSHYSQEPVTRNAESSVVNPRASDSTNMPPPRNGFRRFSGARSMPMIMPAVPSRIYFRSSGGGLYFRDLEREEAPYPIIPGYHRASRGSDSNTQAHWF